MLDRPAPPPGWSTSDDHEVTLRRWRGRTEILSVKATEPDHPYFGTFRTQSVSGGTYEVEIRSLTEFTNSCGCIDFRVNGLGTCKHIEGAIEAMVRGRSKSFRAAKAAGSPRVEVFLDRRASAVRIVCCERQRCWRRGGFPEEAPLLLAKVLQKAAAALMAGRSELPAGASAASDTDIQRLVERSEFPHDALIVLEASQPSAELPDSDRLGALFSTAEQILALKGDHGAAVPSLQAA